MLSSYLSPSSSHSHVLRLLQTTRSARTASIQALHMQYQRMLPPPQLPERESYHDIPGAFPGHARHPTRHDSVTRRRSSRCRSRSRSPPRPDDPGEIGILPYPKPDHGEISIQPYPQPPPKHDHGETSIQPYPKPHPKHDHDEISIQPYPKPHHEPDHGEISILPYPKPHPKPDPQPQGRRLFCVYARDLQTHPRLPLTDNFKEGGNNMCPFCHAHAPMRPGKAWEIITNNCDCEGRPERRVFLVKNRFVIKCHKEGQGFACILCARFKESDTVCRELGALMDHLWREHTSQELEKDDDVFEIDE